MHILLTSQCISCWEFVCEIWLKNCYYSQVNNTRIYLVRSSLTWIKKLRQNGKRNCLHPMFVFFISLISDHLPMWKERPTCHVNGKRNCLHPMFVFFIPLVSDHLPLWKERPTCHVIRIKKGLTHRFLFNHSPSYTHFSGETQLALSWTWGLHCWNWKLWNLEELVQKCYEQWNLLFFSV